MPSPPAPAFVLVVEDSEADALRARRLLEQVGVPAERVEVARSLDAGFDILRARSPDLILLDLHVGPTHTIDHIPRILEEAPQAAIIVLTGSTQEAMAEEALGRGAQDYLLKEEVSAGTLRRAMRYAMNRQQYQQSAREGLVAKKIVRRLLRDLGRHTGSASHRRELGRSLAAEVGGETVQAYLTHFAALGAGQLRLDRHEGDRYDFRGVPTIETSPGVNAPTCYIPLGFLEGAIAEVTGLSALGAETQCQSQGHAECRFAVKARKP